MVEGQPNERLVSDLEIGSRFLSQLHEQFYRHFTFDDSRIICVHETKETHTVEVGKHMNIIKLSLPVMLR